MKVAVIGAGASGLTALKACLEENLKVTCFEKENVIGGLWHFTEIETHSSVMRSTIINTSKQMMSYSDFPIPHEFPNFMHNTKVMEYMERYAKNFDLYKHIKFGTVVKNVYRAENYDATGQWKVEWAPLGKEIVNTHTEVFDAVLLCTGHHWKKHWPKFDGMDIFEGKQIHSKSYKDVKGYENKVVVCVGIGNSSGDISCELSRCAKQVYLSTRRGSWVLSRHGFKGEPIDHSVTRFMNKIPLSVLDYIFPKLLNFFRFNHKLFGLQPNHSVFSQHPMMNDDLPLRISSGTVKIKPNIERLTKNGVVFTDGSSIENVDVLIYCTGYQISFPVLERNTLVQINNNQFDLYKLMFLPQLKHQTLAILGVFQPIGALNPLVDLQARLAVRVFLKIVILPNEISMLNDIKSYREAVSKKYYNSPRHTVQVDFIPYSDDIAKVIGCRPNLLKMLFTDPALAWKCYFDPCYPQQYRLVGPHTWSDARKYIMTAHRYVYTSQIQENKHEDKKRISSNVWMLLLIIIILIIIIIANF